MEPPWIAHPDIPFMSIGWRMGCGDDYRIKFDRWHKALTRDAREQFERNFPAPQSWPGFYERKRAHLDSWLVRPDLLPPHPQT